MGCITSTKKLNELRNHGQNDNVFRVRVVRLLSDSPSVLTGYLELTPRELIFYAPGHEPVAWALQHLRRYGLSGDLFSFEAGRRCMSGPGIYNFRCQDAEEMYPMFQRYINAVNTEHTFIAGGVGGIGPDQTSTTHTMLMRSDINPHANTYLEPAPSIGGSSGNNVVIHANETQNGDASPRTPIELDSPDSLPSPLGLSNDMGSVTPSQANQNPAQSPLTPSEGTYSNTNLYFDQPMRTISEHNNNKKSYTSIASAGISTSNNSNFSTTSRPTLLRGSSLDIPPLESAPSLCNRDALHMYANVAPLDACSLRDRFSFENAERCYENVNRLNLPILLQHPQQNEVSQRSVLSPQQQQQPTSPTNSTCSDNVCGDVKYIVLDLDQPRSPTQCSPKIKTGFGSGLSLTPTDADRMLPSAAATTLGSEQPNTCTITVSTPTATTPTATLEQHKPETSLGYSTIDFIKTWALIKSTTHGAEFDRLRSQDEEVRLNRHCKCVRKSYSVSE